MRPSVIGEAKGSAGPPSTVRKWDKADEPGSLSESVSNSSRGAGYPLSAKMSRFAQFHTEESVLRNITDSDLGQASVAESSGTPAC